MAKSVVQFEVTSEHPCQIPVIGEFAAGETKVLDAATIELFEKNFGYPVGQARFTRSVTFTAKLINVPDEKKEA